MQRHDAALRRSANCRRGHALCGCWSSYLPWWLLDASLRGGRRMLHVVRNGAISGMVHTTGHWWGELNGGTKQDSGLSQSRNASDVSLSRVRRSHRDRKSTRLNSSHLGISYAVFCLKKKNKK